MKKSVFKMNGEMNRHKFRYWAKENPHWMEDIKCQESEKHMVRLGLIDTTIIGPYFFEVNAVSYTHLTLPTIYSV